MAFFLQKIEISFIYLVYDLTFPLPLSSGCFGYGYKLNYTTVNFTLPLYSLEVHHDYTFRVVIWKPSREETYAEQTIIVVPGDPPIVAISCFSNCMAIINSRNKLSLKGHCQNCASGESLTYRWSLSPKPSREGDDDFRWVAVTTTGIRRPNLVIKSHVFSGTIQETYTLRLAGEILL